MRALLKTDDSPVGWYLSQFVVVGFDDRTKVVDDAVYESMLSGEYWVGKLNIMNSRRFWVLDKLGAT